MIHVTVVVPCFNRAGTAEAAVRSVLAQTYPHFDVVAVDDGSEDATLAVLNSINDPRLTVLQNTGPKGVCGARNTGAANAKGTWIAFQDSDDLWHPEKLEKQIAKVKSGNPVAVYCAMAIVKGEGLTKKQVGRVPRADATGHTGDIRKAVADTSLISTQTLMIRKDIFAETLGFDPDFEALVDWELMIRVAEKGQIAFVDEELVTQRLSDNSITRSTRKRLTAQEKLLAKHHALIAHYPVALAKHHFRIAGAQRQFRQFDQAALNLRNAIRHNPRRPKYYVMWGYVTLRRLIG